MSLNVEPVLWDVTLQPSGIKAKIMEGYPQGSFEEFEATVTDKFIIRSQDFYRFTLSLFPAYENVFPGAESRGRNWVYTLGRNFGWQTYESLPTQPDQTLPPFLVSRKISFEPFPLSSRPMFPSDLFQGRQGLGFLGLPTDQMIYQTYTQYIQITVEYSTGKTTDDKDDILEITANASGEFLLIPSQGKLSWQTSDVGVVPVTKETVENLNIPITQVVPGIEWTVKYKRVLWDDLSLALEECRSLIGCVNSRPMIALRSSPAETVLLVGFSWTPRNVWWIDKSVVEIEMKFLERSIRIPDPASPDNPDTYSIAGHNHFYNPKTGLWQYLLKENNDKMYTSRDLKSLLWT